MLHITLEKLANAHCTSTVCTVYTHTVHTVCLLPTCLLHSLNRSHVHCARQFPPIKQRRQFALASVSILLLWYRGFRDTIRFSSWYYTKIRKAWTKSWSIMNQYVQYLAIPATLHFLSNSAFFKISIQPLKLFTLWKNK